MSAPRWGVLTSRQKHRRYRDIDQALDLLDTLWRMHASESYDTARSRQGFIGKARRALVDLRGAP